MKNAKSKLKLVQKSKVSKSVEDQVMQAYSDCHEELGYGERNLSFRASEPITNAEEFATLMKRAVTAGYNNFDAEIIEGLAIALGNSEIYIAREGSPCLYIKPHASIECLWLDRYRADEVSYDATTGEFRLWWD